MITTQEIIKQTNDYRAQKGLPPLKVSDTLMKAAQKRAEDMAKSGIFSHTASEDMKGDPIAWDYISKSGYQFNDAGENLAEGYRNATDTMKAWQDSPTHNANLMNSRYGEMGIAVVPVTYKGKKTEFIIHFFGNPKSAAIPASTPKKTAPAPTAKKPVVVNQVAPIIPQVSPAKTLRPFAIPMQNANSTIPMVQGGMKLKLN